MSTNEIIGSIESLDPKNIYTQETRVFRSQLRSANLAVPINYGVDCAGHVYVDDGNARCLKALQEGKMVMGIRIARMKSDITSDPDFHPVRDLKIIEN